MDKADLTQTIIIIAGLAIASIVGIGGISTVVMEKGEALSTCISKNRVFEPVSNPNLERNCEEIVMFKTSTSCVAGYAPERRICTSPEWNECTEVKKGECSNWEAVQVSIRNSPKTPDFSSYEDPNNPPEGYTCRRLVPEGGSFGREEGTCDFYLAKDTTIYRTYTNLEYI